MLGNIEFIKENKQSNRSTIFNYLGKVATAISIPLFIHSAIPSETPPKTEPDTAQGVSAQSNTARDLSEEQIKRLEMLGSIILASAGLSFRRRYVLEENLKQKFVTDDANRKDIYARIEGKKQELFAREYIGELDKNIPGPLPNIFHAQNLYPYLFMNEDEIGRLQLQDQPMAYMVQNTCMRRFLREGQGRGYHPEIERVAENRNWQSLYLYDDMMAVLKKDNGELREKFHAKFASIDFEISEKVMYAPVEDEVSKRVETNGIGTAALTVFVPVIPAIYSNLSAAKQNFFTATPVLKETMPFNLKRLDNNVRQLFSEPENYSFEYRQYSSITSSMMPRPL